MQCPLKRTSNILHTKVSTKSNIVIDAQFNFTFNTLKHMTNTQVCSYLTLTPELFLQDENHIILE